MGTTRNGQVEKPETGERGANGASSYLGESLFRYGNRRAPTVTELHNMIEFDPWAEAIEGALTWPIRSGNWSIVPHEDDRGEADLVREQFKRIGTKAVAGSLTAIGRRVAAAEQVWGLSGRYVVLEDLAFRPHDQFTVVPDKNGRPAGFRQKAYAPGRGFVNEEFLFEDRKAFVYFHDGQTRPGVGRSALGSAYQYYIDKDKVRFYRFKSLEKYGGPSTHGKTAARPGSDERAAFDRVVVDARSGASITTGLEDEIGYLTPPNAGDAFQSAIRDINFEMAVASFVQWLALAQEGNSGAYELSRDHSNFLTIVTEGRMTELADSLTAGPVRDITFYNFGPGAAFPSFHFAPLSEHISERIIRVAEKFVSTTGRAMPRWLVEGLVDGFAEALDIEKPEDADPVGKPVKTREPDRGDDNE